MADSRFASGSRFQAGERRTVRHGFGSLRQGEAVLAAMIGTSRSDNGRKAANSYAF